MIGTAAPPVTTTKTTSSVSPSLGYQTFKTSTPGGAALTSTTFYFSTWTSSTPSYHETSTKRSEFNRTTSPTTKLAVHTTKSARHPQNVDGPSAAVSHKSYSGLVVALSAVGLLVGQSRYIHM